MGSIHSHAFHYQLTLHKMPSILFSCLLKLLACLTYTIARTVPYYIYVHKVIQNNIQLCIYVYTSLNILVLLYYMHTLPSSSTLNSFAPTNSSTSTSSTYRRHEREKGERMSRESCKLNMEPSLHWSCPQVVAGAPLPQLPSEDWLASSPPSMDNPTARH